MEGLRLRRRGRRKRRTAGEMGEKEKVEEEEDAVWQVEEDTVTQHDVLPAHCVISSELP